MSPEEALDVIAAQSEPGRAPQMEAYHKVARPYLGVPNGALDAIATDWRHRLPLDERLALAAWLWTTNVFEARIAAAKLMTQARIRPEDIAAWRLVAGWVPEFDSWAIADAVAKAGERRLTADPRRLDEVETWLEAADFWPRRAALVMTLPWARMPHPKPEDEAARERILGWAAQLAGEREWFVQKAVGWWLRELSKRSPERVRSFLDRHGAAMKPFARREAGKYLG